MKKIILISIITIIIASIIIIVGDKIARCFPEYVLFKSGINHSDVILSMDREGSKIYLFRNNSKGQTKIGLIRLCKFNSDALEWKVYSLETQELSNKNIFLWSYYSTVVNGRPAVNSIMAGCVYTNNNKDFKLQHEKDIPFKPLMVKEDSNGAMFFLHDFGYWVTKNGSSHISVVRIPK
jgi:hypothetical protein